MNCGSHFNLADLLLGILWKFGLVNSFYRMFHLLRDMLGKKLVNVLSSSSRSCPRQFLYLLNVSKHEFTVSKVRRSTTPKNSL